MLKTYAYPKYPYVMSAEQRADRIVRHPVVVVGAGPVGLAAALDLARRGLRVLLLDDNDTVSVGSRAVCYAKRPLEILDRLGCAEPALKKGVSWQIGKVFHRDRLSYQFDLLPEAGHKMPAMINLQQYHLEEMLIESCLKDPNIEIRWRHQVLSLADDGDEARLAVETPDGIYKIAASWVIACDGANSELRRMVGAEFKGQFFQDRFLIADVVMKADFPAERWFWFDPPFHPGQSVLLHKQADNIWRIDFQLGWAADPTEERRPERVIPRIRAMLGETREFDLEWVSIYQFACRRIEKFRYGRVLFAGDAAHQVSPFGARGANTGFQDTDNLAWKLALVVSGLAPEALLDTYDEERAVAADDNLLNSTRSTDFITPKNAASRRFRDAVLELAEDTEMARPLVNSGRLSRPTPYSDSRLNTPDADAFDGLMTPGTNCADAPIAYMGKPAWLLEHLGRGFCVLAFGDKPRSATVGPADLGARVLHVGTDIADRDGLLTRRYDGKPGTTYLIRPDQYVAARWRSFDVGKIESAIRRAIAA